MKKNIYMVIHEINEKKGGATTVSMARTKLFQGKKYSSNILTFGFKANYKEIENKMKEIGKLSKESSILNMYDFFRSHEKNIEKNIYIDDDENMIHNLATNYNNSIKNEEIDIHSYKISEKKSNYLKIKNENSSIEFIFSDAILYRMTIINSDKNEIIEKYFSKNGFCYLIKKINSANNATTGIFLIYENYKFHFENEKGLENYFLNLLINNNSQKNEESIFIIDGQGSLRRALNLSKKNCKVYFVLHTNHLLRPYKNNAKIHHKIERIFNSVKELDGLVVLTERQRRDIINIFGNEDKIFAIPNYIQKTKLKKIAKNKNEIIIVSRLVPEKRIDMALKIFKEVTLKIPDAKLNIYGRGIEEQKLKNLIVQLNLENNAFLKGHTHDVMEKFEESSINLLTSETEAFALTIIEALLSQTPTVSFDINYGPSDIINSGINGVVVSNEKEMINTLISMLKNHKKTKKMGIKGRKNIINNNSSKILIKQWESMFNSR